MTEKNDKKPSEAKEDVLDSDSSPEERSKDPETDFHEAYRRMYQSLVDRGVF